MEKEKITSEPNIKEAGEKIKRIFQTYKIEAKNDMHLIEQALKGLLETLNDPIEEWHNREIFMADYGNLQTLHRVLMGLGKDENSFIEKYKTVFSALKRDCLTFTDGAYTLPSESVVNVPNGSPLPKAWSDEPMGEKYFKSILKKRLKSCPVLFHKHFNKTVSLKIVDNNGKKINALNVETKIIPQNYKIDLEKGQFLSDVFLFGKNLHKNFDLNSKEAQQLVNTFLGLLEREKFDFAFSCKEILLHKSFVDLWNDTILKIKETARTMDSSLREKYENSTEMKPTPPLRDGVSG